MSVQAAEQIASSPVPLSWTILVALGIVMAIAVAAWIDCSDPRDRWKQDPGSKDTGDSE